MPRISDVDYDDPATVASTIATAIHVRLINGLTNTNICSHFTKRDDCYRLRVYITRQSGTLNCGVTITDDLVRVAGLEPMLLSDPATTIEKIVQTILEAMAKH